MRIGDFETKANVVEGRETQCRIQHDTLGVRPGEATVRAGRTTVFEYELPRGGIAVRIQLDRDVESRRHIPVGLWRDRAPSKGETRFSARRLRASDPFEVMIRSLQPGACVVAAGPGHHLKAARRVVVVGGLTVEVESTLRPE